MPSPSVRTRPVAVLTAAVLLLTALLIAGCGSSSGSGAAPRNTVPSSAANTLSVTPTHPMRRSAITFAFTAPKTSAVSRHETLSDSLSITGTSEPGCAGFREASMPPAAPGARSMLTLGPAQLGRPWCVGRYSARVIELARARCTGRAPCPQYIRVVAIVARATFVVASG